MAGLFSKSKGLTLVVSGLAVPVMILLLLGALEVSRAVGVNSTLIQFTREAGNLTSRGTEVSRSLTTAIAATAPTLRDNNKQQWKVIYSQLRKQPGKSCSSKPCPFQVDSRVEVGDLNEPSTIGVVKKPVIISNGDSIGSNQVFHSIEVYYDYRPELFGWVGNIIKLKFYERSVYTDLAMLR